MADLVTRLREAAQWQFKTEPALYGEAADCIGQQKKRNEELEAALILITQTAPFGEPQEIARKVLREKKNASA